jgi:erythronate-4-phosphate dehydrogenase
MKIVADENIPFVAECFSSIGEVKTLSGRRIDPGTVKNADILLVRSITKVDSKLLAESQVRFVGTATIGLEHVDTEFLSSRNIGFASAPGSNANSVAEYVVAALLAVGKKHKIQLEGKSIGIVGVGNVGSKVAKKCAALGMKIYLNDPPLQRYISHREHRGFLATEDTEGTERFSKSKERKKEEISIARIKEYLGEVKLLPIEELFSCDFITLHTPLTFEGIDKTFHLADEKFFNSLKTGCIFINTARGAVHDTIALKQAITSGRLKAAILDVWENEPNIDVELLRMVDLSTPHISGYSLDGKIAGMIMIYKAVCGHFGLEPKYDVADFLPEPQVPQIHIDPQSDTEQNLLHQAVQQVYVINRDDFNTREIAMVPVKKRGRFFDDLRKNYPVRREFQNTRIVLADSVQRIANSQRISEKLGGIGFKI